MRVVSDTLGGRPAVGCPSAGLLRLALDRGGLGMDCFQRLGAPGELGGLPRSAPRPSGSLAAASSADSSVRSATRPLFFQIPQGA
jgi:hypothetical protein